MTKIMIRPNFLGLKHFEWGIIFDFLIKSGYVFDFSNASFDAFTEESIGIRVKAKYESEGLSKGKSLRRFILEDASEREAIKLLKDLLEYYELRIKDSDSYEAKLYTPQDFAKVEPLILRIDEAYARPQRSINKRDEAQSYRRQMMSEHEHYLRCKDCSEEADVRKNASEKVVDSLLKICNQFKTGYVSDLEERYSYIGQQLKSLPQGSEVDITRIKLHTIRYIIELDKWSPYLRGIAPERPRDITYDDTYSLNVGEWVKCTILPYILDPLKNVITQLPKFNAVSRAYPLAELHEMFQYLEAMIGMLNYCEEEETSAEASYFGYAILAVYRLHQLVCPSESRLGHVNLERQRISRAYADLFRRMCNAAWALGFKVEDRDKNEIDLEDELKKVLPSPEGIYNRSSLKEPQSQASEKNSRTSSIVVESFSPTALAQLHAEIKGFSNKRENVIAYIRTLYKARRGCESWKSTVGYVRNMTDENNPDFPKCAAAQAYIKSIAKKEKDGIDKAWNSLAQEAKPSHGKKKKSEDLGPVPILSKGADFL